jgi:hypothetical protein
MNVKQEWNCSQRATTDIIRPRMQTFPSYQAKFTHYFKPLLIFQSTIHWWENRFRSVRIKMSSLENGTTTNLDRKKDDDLCTELGSYTDDLSSDISRTNDCLESNFHRIYTDTKERNLPGLLTFPDVEDTSMAHVFAYIEHYQEDLFWSFLSDSFFIVGGMVYVTLSIWDYFDWDAYNMCYKTLMIMGPLVYLVNSIIDIIWASRVSQRNKMKSRLQQLWSDACPNDSVMEMERTSDESIINRQKNDRAIIQANLMPQKPTFSSFAVATYKKIRRHAAHRRTFLAAITFGAAALVAFVAVLIDSSHQDEDNAVADYCNHISVHAYLLSAVISVTGKRTRPWLAQRSCLDNHETLEDLGDILFLIGSLVDDILIDANIEDSVAYMPLLSSLLWLLDACFYILSDFVMAEKFRRHYLPGSLDSESDESEDEVDYSRLT